jgi:hypothetical protein
LGQEEVDFRLKNLPQIKCPPESVIRGTREYISNSHAFLCIGYHAESDKRVMRIYQQLSLPLVLSLKRVKCKIELQNDSSEPFATM